MGTKKKMLQAAGGSAGLDITDVFSTYLYTGTGATQTITNGVDLAGEGGLVWFKKRDAVYNHVLQDTARGAGVDLYSNLNVAEINYSGSYGISSFNSAGFSLVGAGTATNVSGGSYVSWTFRKAPKFFDVVTYTGTGSAQNISHSLDTTVGSIIIKRTDTTSDWAVYHRSNTAAPETDYLALNTTAATADLNTYWNDTAPTSTVFTVGTNAVVNASAGTYVAYLFAHNNADGGFGPDADQDIIKCGSYTGNGSATGPEIDLGFEPQWVMVKGSTSVTGWPIVDNMRGMTVDGTTDSILYANLNVAEDTSGRFTPKPDGFQVRSPSSWVNTSGQTYTYMAIRRGPLAPPAAGTEVFKAALHNGDLGYEQFIPSGGTGFPVDLLISAARKWSNQGNKYFINRLADTRSMTSTSAAAEVFGPDLPIATLSGYQDSIRIGSAGEINGSTWPNVDYFFRRAPSFFDVVAYTGNNVAGRTISHSLGVAPEMIWVKKRSGMESWAVYHNLYGGTHLARLDQAGAFGSNSNVWDNTNPTASVFTVDTDTEVNQSGETYIAYLFATLAGVSKVGSYTGNGTSQTINAGFTAGARFILIKRTDSAGNWYVWDTVRGVIAGNDPHLSLNRDWEEVTTNDSIDPDSSGFIVNQAYPSINVTSATYIYYAIA